jgi:hypothetical protein
MIPKPTPCRIWPATHPAVRPTNNMIRRLLPDMYMFVPCVREKEDNPPTLVKLRPCQGNDCTKLLTSRGCDRVLAKSANLSLDLFSLDMRLLVQNNIQQ